MGIDNREIARELARDGLLMTPARVQEIKEKLLDRVLAVLEHRLPEGATEDQINKAVLEVAQIWGMARGRTLEGQKELWTLMARKMGAYGLALVRHRIEKEIEPRYFFPGNPRNDMLAKLQGLGWEVLEVIDLPRG